MPWIDRPHAALLTPLTSRDRYDYPAPVAAPHDPATCINGVLGCCPEPACQSCVIVQDSAQTFICETHGRAVEQDDAKSPSRCDASPEA
jgi:hypothetical protein